MSSYETIIIKLSKTYILISNNSLYINIIYFNTSSSCTLKTPQGKLMITVFQDIIVQQPK